jgi:hypothetical protein
MQCLYKLHMKGALERESRWVLFYILLLTNSWKNHEVQIASLINICIINLIRREPGGQGRNPGKWLPFYWNEVGRES